MTLPEKKTQENFRWKSSGFNVSEYLIDSAVVKPLYVSKFGALFSADCLHILPLVKSGCVDTVFADPPFNIGKEYGENFKDNIEDDKYIEWCKKWLAECTRILKPEGSLFVYNLPKWNVPLCAYLMDNGMQFRHWIAVEMSAGLPIQGRLYPSHYGLIYLTKGKPKTFRKIRTPIATCRHCKGEIKDYGGHRKSMNPNGVNLKDIWSDIPPVRHSKFKSKHRKANALSTKLLDRVIEMSTQPGDLVFDPFGGSGTTYVVSENKRRYWIGTELDYGKDIVDRMEIGEIASHKNTDYVEEL